jgi:hypothetical protein
VITSDFLTEIRNESLLRVAQIIKRFDFEELTMDAFEEAQRRMRGIPRKAEVLEQIKEFLGHRTAKNVEIIDQFTRYLQTVSAKGLPWAEEPSAAMDRVPRFVRELAKQTVEDRAKQRGDRVVTPEIVREILADFAQGTTGPPGTTRRGERPLTTLPWSEEARQRLQRIPLPFVRQRIAQRVEAHARAQGLGEVTLQVYEASKG